VLAWLLLGITLMPLCFVTVSQTMRTQRVRLTHVMRMAAYGIIATLVVFAGWSIAALLWWWLSDQTSIRYRFWTYSDEGMGALWLWWPLVMALWWWCACRRYLRIRHAMWVAFLLQLMATVLAYLLVYPFIDVGSWIWLIDR